MFFDLNVLLCLILKIKQHDVFLVVLSSKVKYCAVLTLKFSVYCVVACPVRYEQTGVSIHDNFHYGHAYVYSIKMYIFRLRKVSRHWKRSVVCSRAPPTGDW